MLFPYTYVPHKMEKMQEFIDFIFFAVWCKASTHGDYGLHVFYANAKLYAIIEQFHYSDSKGAYFFNSNVELVYGEFKRLLPRDIKKIKRWYKGNNDIERICANDPSAHLARYCDIKTLYPDLERRLGVFFKGLYEELNIAALRSHIGDIDNHYDSFMQINNKGKCPFCGMNDLLGEYHTKREAYDHYLPKGIYPFNSINFRNLVPACHHCNSSYKTSKDLAFQPKHPTHKAQGSQRRKAFSPYAAQPHAIEINIELLTKDIPNLKPQDVLLQFGPAQVSEEIETWRDVYGIDERYKAKVCSESDGKAWLVAVLDEWKHDERTPQNYLTTLARQERQNPWADCRFLKKPFLEACQGAGLFS